MSEKVTHQKLIAALFEEYESITGQTLPMVGYSGDKDGASIKRLLKKLPVGWGLEELIGSWTRFLSTTDPFERKKVTSFPVRYWAEQPAHWVPIKKPPETVEMKLNDLGLYVERVGVDHSTACNLCRGSGLVITFNTKTKYNNSRACGCPLGNKWVPHIREIKYSLFSTESQNPVVH